MSIDKILFQNWWKANPGVCNEQAIGLYTRLSKTQRPNSILSTAIRKGQNFSFLDASVMSAPQGVQKSQTETRSPTAQTFEAKKKPAFVQIVIGLFNKINQPKKATMEDGPDIEAAPRRKLSRKNLKLIGYGVGVLILIAVVIFAFSYFSRHTATPDITFPVPTMVPEVPMVIPTEVAVVIPEQVARTAFQMHAPVSIPELFSNPDWKFLIFVGVMILMIILAKQERFNEQQQTDWKVIKIGLILVAVGLLLSNLTATALTQLVAFVIGVTFVVDPLWVQILFLFGAFVAFTTAAITGKVDWTPLSVGMFTTGGFLVALNPVGPGRIVGYVCIVLGVCVHIYELTTEQGTAGALGMVLVGLPLFIGGRFGFEALLSLISKANLAGNPQILVWLANSAYDGRVILATVLSLLISFALASVVASAIFPPIARMLPQGGQLVGSFVPTEDTPRIDAMMTFLMGIVCFWLLAGHF